MSAINLLFLAACGRPVTIEAVTAEVSDDVATVVTVRWETSEAVSSHVAFGLDGKSDRVTADTPEGTEHEAILLGLPADADVTFQVVAGDEASDAKVVTTGSLPDGIPAIAAEGTPSDQFLLLSTTGTTNWVLMLDPEGRVVWYHQDNRGLSVFRSHALRDGSGIVYSSVIEQGRPSPNSEMIWVPWVGAPETTVAVPDLAHDFVERTDGTIVSLGSETRDEVEGNNLLAIDVAGTVSPLWSTFDCYDPVENPGDDPAQGWTHANALDYDDESGDYIVGMRNLATLARVDDETGACVWGFGGTGGTVDIDGTRFIHQHQFEYTPGQMLVFDNDGAAGNVSRVIEYDFDEAAQTATEVAVFEADPPLYSFIMGDVHRVENGETVILWSSPKTVDRYDASGNRLWRIEIDSESPLGFVELLDL